MYHPDASVSGASAAPADSSFAPFNADPLPAADISNTLAVFGKGYAPKSGDRQHIINQTKLLAGLSSTASEDATGRCLYHNIMHLVKKLHPVFLSVVDSNFDCCAEQARIVHLRIDLLEAKAQDEYAASLQPYLPSDMAFTHRKDVLTAEKLEELEATIPQESDPVKIERRRANIAQQISALILMLKTDHLNSIDKYEADLVLQRDAAFRLKTHQAQIAALENLESFVESLSLYQHTIATRLNATLNDSSSAHSANLTSIQVKLKGTASLHNGDVVDPLVNFHLPGLLWLLHHTYVVDSLNHYFDALTEAFSYTMALTEAQNTPDVALARLVSISNDWHMRGLFERLSQDLLFTCLAVKSVPTDAPFRSYLITETTQYMRRLHSGEVTSASRTPVFDYVKTLAARFVSDMRLQSHPGVPASAAMPAQPSPTTGTKPNRPYGRGGQYNRFNPRPAQPQLENAAAAIVPAVAPSASSGPSGYVPRVDCAGQRFSGEVPVSRNLSHNGVPYMAVARLSAICPVCFPDSGTGIPCPQNPRHYRGKCPRCHFYGHKLPNCLQSHSADGKPIP